MHAHALPPRLPEGRRLSNRVKAIMIHTVWYSTNGQARLCQDCQVSKSTINRLIRGETDPYYALAAKVTDALAKRLGVPLDVREVFR